MMIRTILVFVTVIFIYSCEEISSKLDKLNDYMMKVQVMKHQLKIKQSKIDSLQKELKTCGDMEPELDTDLKLDESFLNEGKYDE